MASVGSSSVSGDSRDEDIDSSSESVSISGDESVDSSSSGDEDERISKDLLYNVFSNLLISDTFMEHLSLGEMKALSLSSKFFFNLVRTSKRFKSKAVVVVPDNEDIWFDDDTENLDLETLMSSSSYSNVTDDPWRGLKIDLAIRVKQSQMNRLLPFGNSLEYLALVKMNPKTWIWPGMMNVMQNLLSCTPTLKHLVLDHVVFFKETSDNLKLADVFLDQKVRKNLANLELLEISEMDFARQKFAGECDAFEWRRRVLPGENNMDSFYYLAKIPMKLKIFKTNRMTTSWELRGEHVKVLLKNNRETLEELWMHASWWKMEDLRELYLPNLKTLNATLRGEETDQRVLADFLKKNPQIQKLDLQILKHGRMFFVLIDSIQEHCKNLTKLHLEASEFFGGIGGRTVDWPCLLYSMSRLVDIKILIPQEDNVFGAGGEILSALPKNQLQTLKLETDILDTCYFWASDEKSDTHEDQVERIRRRRIRRSSRGPMGRGMGIWRGLHCESSDTDEEMEVGNMSDLDLQISNRMRMNLLGGFTCLKSLSIVAKNAIDDFLMQFIIKEFTSLEELEISNSSKLTDIGVTGKWGESVLGLPISQMKELKKLTIRECPHVTHDGIRKSVRFKTLKYLNYKNSQFYVPQSFVFQIVKQNPSLEELSLKFYFEESDEEILHKTLLVLLCSLRQVNQRLVKIWGSVKSQSYWAHSIFGCGSNVEDDCDCDSEVSLRHMELCSNLV